MGIWYRLYLTASEQEQLKQLISKRKASSKQVVRAQLLLAIAENGLNKTDKEAAYLYGTTTRSSKPGFCKATLTLALPKEQE